MEAFSRRRSLWHNGIAGGILGYVGVERGYLGVPLYQYRELAPAQWGFLMYGAMGIAFGSLSGKHF